MKFNMLTLSSLVLIFATCAYLSNGAVYFSESFGPGWESRWVESKTKPDHETGKIGLSAGKYFGSEEEEGLQTQSDARHYAISAEFPEFSNKDKTLVIQYTLKQEQNIDCGGGYLKLHPASLQQQSYNGDSEYNVMFGPDICGSNKRTHAIFNKHGNNHLIKSLVPPGSDTYTHVYTLVIKPDNFITILIDGEERKSTTLENDWDILLPRTIKDPSQSKPEDWVDQEFIDDADDQKPSDWDDEPRFIADPEAAKPEDWDLELDGEWEAPTIPNPQFRGEWTPKQVPNPLYKGEWEHPVIANPEFKEDPELYAFDSFKYVGIEIWQVKSGSIFDAILITDSEEEAKTAREPLLKRAPREAELQKEEEEKIAKEEEEKELANQKELEEARKKDEEAAQKADEEAASSEAVVEAAASSEAAVEAAAVEAVVDTEQPEKVEQDEL